MRLLLTGGTGFIGGHLLARLIARGDHIRVLALPETVGEIRRHRQVRVIAGTLADHALLARAARGMDVVVHMAAKVTGLVASEFRDVNIDGTRNLLDASIRAGVGRFLFMSSTAVYGLVPFPVMWPLDEDSPLAAHGGRRVRLYGWSKIQAERAVRYAHHDAGLEFVIVRPTVVYGRDAVGAERVLKAMLQYLPAAWFEYAPNGVLQWMHVNDLVLLLERCLISRAAANETFNAAGPQAVAVGEAIGAVRAILEPGCRSAVRPRAAARVLVPPFDIDKTRRRLGFTPKIRLPDGFKEMFGSGPRRQWSALSDSRVVTR